jgi:hypothetical protein
VQNRRLDASTRPAELAHIKKEVQRPLLFSYSVLGVHATLNLKAAGRPHRWEDGRRSPSYAYLARVSLSPGQPKKSHM